MDDHPKCLCNTQQCSRKSYYNDFILPEAFWEAMKTQLFSQVRVSRTPCGFFVFGLFFVLFDWIPPSYSSCMVQCIFILIYFEPLRVGLELSSAVIKGNKQSKAGECNLHERDIYIYVIHFKSCFPVWNEFPLISVFIHSTEQ